MSAYSFCQNLLQIVRLVKNGTALKCATCHRVYAIKDDMPVLEACRDQWSAFEQHQNVEVLCRMLLARTDFWGEDLSTLPDLTEGVSAQLSRILQVGVRQAISTLT